MEWRCDFTALQQIP